MPALTSAQARQAYRGAELRDSGAQLSGQGESRLVAGLDLVVSRAERLQRIALQGPQIGRTHQVSKAAEFRDARI